MKNIFFKFSIIISLFLCTTSVFAHTAVTVTVPKNGAVLFESPEQIIIRFSDEAYLNSIVMFDSENMEVPLTFSLPKAQSRRISIPLPSLNKGLYTAIWSAEGTDTHEIKGELSFTIE